ncbi:uncharacterized protein DS421_16g545170 [Arachis hypogaea]|nr:uncharacterized protein DS421_16g545170 [Arachis hypogaea]
MSSKAKQSLKTSILKQESSDSEVMQKIDQLLNRHSTIPETPTNSGESTSRIQTRSSKAINALAQDSNESSSDQSDDSDKSTLKVSPIMTNSITKWKGLTKPSALSYNRMSTPDLALKERELGFVSFNANNVYEWNIDGKTEYNIMCMLQHMTMVGISYQAAHETSEEAIANIIVSGFSGQLKGWWDNYLSDDQKQSIFSAIMVNDQNEPILGDDEEPIPDAVNILIFTIASHFIGIHLFGKIVLLNYFPISDAKLCFDFRWYKDTFFTGVYTREDSQQPFWKKKFLAGFPKSLGDKVKDKIHSLTPDGIIPYDALSYGQIISFIQKVALKIYQDDKIQRQLAHEKNKIVSIWELSVNNLVFLLVIQRDLKDHPIKKFLNLILKRISEDQEKVFKDPKMKKIEEQINNILIESSDDDSGPESSDDINNIQVDDIGSSSDSYVKEINVLPKDQDLLFEAIEAIGDPE